MAYHGTQHDFGYKYLNICSKIIFPLKLSQKYCMTSVHSPNDIELVPLELIHSSRDALGPVHMEVGTPERWGTSPTRERNTCVHMQPGDAGWGPKCNHLVAKHAHKQRTIVCSDEAAFRFNVVVASKTLVWFRWLAWLSDSSLKFSPALSISSAF